MRDDDPLALQVVPAAGAKGSGWDATLGNVLAQRLLAAAQPCGELTEGEKVGGEGRGGRSWLVHA